MAKKQLSSPPPPPLGAQEQLFSFFRMQSTSARKGGERRGWGWSTARETEKGEVGLLFSLPFNFLGKEEEEEEERDRVREGGSITRWPARAEEEEAEAEYPVVGQSVVKSSDYRLIGILLAWTDDVLARHSKGRDSPMALDGEARLRRAESTQRCMMCGEC